ncbi:hypothetical protein GGU11DRAFT_576893 [Lentinula aff. detonsa]|uniref:Uncharacterized protein n=1 Tax=Lentinula aff. detonsa TaxID=2804958 RepID=A0AA38NUF8_9AGAR|nr:hypothetical protein GGU10DRAFT_338393 [Lentinula aff. detonsa]KAJ3802469.1 hypothetical protein GGU11DRAFT_576893 [Lentinula aff. detonsa]
MNSLTYVEVPNQNLVCCICRMPFVNPCTNQTCFHTFCRECIIQSLAHSPQCPIDRSNLQIEDIHPADPIIRSLVDELVVKCPNESVGCSYTCQRQLLDTHITTDCSYALDPCGVDGCLEETFRKNAHEHVCVHAPVACEGCNSSVRYNELEAHRSNCTKKLYQCEDCNTEQPCSSRAAHASSCYAATVKCSHEHHGCPWEGRRKDLPSHTKICAYEAIKGFFSVQDAQNATVVNQNNLLKQKVDILESQLRVAQFELCCAQRALGPWFQNPPSRSTSVYPPHGQLPTQLNSSSSSRPYMSPDNQTSITQYFPDIQPSPSTEVETRIHPPTPERPNFAPPSVQSQFPHAAPTQSWQSAGYPPTGTRPRSPQNIVAPLNLNATLEGSLEGLRESIVSLSTSLDSLGRRNEIALANETLRLNEEVMSLRAALHGLRMQVHTIMMDRNAQVTGRGPGIDPLFIQGDSQWLSSNPNRAHIMQNTLPSSITKL